ncbi:MAG: hypothetical protein C4536_08325 [Actinobacteria bacterium]|nr:MAG: hypothetical protein C4536_08325 [Actinomycetota bacterium]
MYPLPKQYIPYIVLYMDYKTLNVELSRVFAKILPFFNYLFTLCLHFKAKPFININFRVYSLSTA